MLNLAVDILTCSLSVIESIHVFFFLFKHGCHMQVGSLIRYILHLRYARFCVSVCSNEIYSHTVMDSLWPVLNKPLSCRMMQGAMLVVTSEVSKANSLF